MSQGQKPGSAFDAEERDRRERLWKVKDLSFSQADGQSVRIVRSDEGGIEKQVRGGRKRRQPRESEWLRTASAHLDGFAAKVIYHAWHRRRGIENKAFNELTQACHLEHCCHHEPVSMLAPMLILLLGFTLFNAFAQLHSTLVVLGQRTAKALAKELDLAVKEDLSWELWFHRG